MLQGFDLTVGRGTQDVSHKLGCQAETKMLPFSLKCELLQDRLLWSQTQGTGQKMNMTFYLPKGRSWIDLVGHLQRLISVKTA